MALDRGYHIGAQALPNPTELPYETPSRGISGKSSRQGSNSPLSNYSPASFPPAEDSNFTKEHGSTDVEEDGRYNSEDTRRLTPNLGISFVSQIHSLKKELETKDILVEDLEDSLHQSRAENGRLNEDLNAQKTEVKSVKYQMSSLEHDMLQALENIAKERDNAIKSVEDSRRHLEATKKKVRAQEEEADEAHSMWEKDKQDWEKNRRKMESNVHIVEERLKTMVAELMAVQSTGQNWPGAGYVVDDGMRETWFMRGNDIRAASRLSNRSVDDTYESKEAGKFPSSSMSGLHEMGGSKMSGLSLADELEMEGDEDDDFDQEGVHSPDALPEELQMLPTRYSEDAKARKVMGLQTDSNEQHFGDEFSGQHSMGIIEDYINLPAKRASVSYTDTATQFTPPPTPALHTKRVDSVSEKMVEQTERAANQSRKRVAIPSLFVDQTPLAKIEGSEILSMVSTSCQTDDIPQRPPSSGSVAQQSPIAVTKGVRSSSTQTTENTAWVSKSASTRLSPTPLDVPVIAIHPPASRPPSSHNSVVLPPRTRNAGCQVAIEIPRNRRSTSMQTEEIRVDKRPIRIPPRLQMSNPPVKSHSRSTERRTRTAKPSIPESSRRHIRSPPPLADKIQVSTPYIPRGAFTSPNLAVGAIEQRRGPAPYKADDTFQGGKDSGPLIDNHSFGPRRPIRSGSIVAGVDATGGDDTVRISDEFSDDDFANAAPIRKTLSKVQNSWKLVPQSVSIGLDRLEPASEELEGRGAAGLSKTKESKAKGPSHTTSKTFQTKSTEGYQQKSSASKPAEIRRQALTFNGITEHAHRARSSSTPSEPGKEPATVAPPFPVPTRSSSRKIPISASEGAASPTPYSTSFFTTRRGQDHGRPPIKRKILRKVQSAAAVSTPSAPQQPQPPPSTSAYSTVPDSPKSLPPTQTQFILPYDSVAEMPSCFVVASQPRSHAGEASIETPSQQTSVVDAIAQTMVGEWMWKYVRKRTSFGITESPQAEFEMSKNGENRNGSGVRHKRWVWLAPYDNAVIWSSKQPTSGPALLGKGGRKREYHSNRLEARLTRNIVMIQSVLDVKDDTPMPKNAGSQSAFDRSILVLTPQRALKFTAVSRERHYIWLTALSFLSHSTRGMDDLASPPPLPQQEYQPPPSHETGVGFRRTPVRDSIRIAKERSRPSLGAHSLSSPIAGAEQGINQDPIMVWGDREAESEDAAEAPQVPRVASHSRKRSNTGPRPVPLSAFHSYPTNSTAIGSSSSLTAPTSRDKYDRFHPLRGASRSGPNTRHATMTRRIVTDPNRDSYVSPAPVVPDNFFDPVGTMRMEAFVRNSMIEDPIPELTKEEPKKAKRSYRTKQGRKKDMSYRGVAESAGLKEDPFTGF